MLFRERCTPRGVQIWFRVSLYMTLGLFVFDWASPIPSLGGFDIYRIALFLLLTAMLICLFYDRGQYFRQLVSIFSQSKFIFWSIFAYILMSIVTLTYSKYPIFSLRRYFSLIQSLFLMFCVYYYVFGDCNNVMINKRLLSLYSVFGVAAALVILNAFLGYFIGYHYVYVRRISTIQDYNQYSSLLLIGFICIIYYLLHIDISFSKRAMLLGGSASLFVPGIILAGSRRSLVLLYIVSISMILYIVIICVSRYIKKRQKRQIMQEMGMLVFCIGLAFISYQFFNQKLDQVAEMRMNECSMPNETSSSQEFYEGDILDNRVIENALDTTYSTIKDGSGLSSRKKIWNIAINEIRKANFKQFMFGFGSSHSWDIYDQMDNLQVKQLRDQYHINDERTHWMNPHNLFLQDMLEGGCILLMLQLSVIISIFFSLKKVLIYSPDRCGFILLLYLIQFVTLFLSSSYGIVYHKFVWIIIGIHIAERYRLSQIDNVINVRVEKVV